MTNSHNINITDIFQRWWEFDKTKIMVLIIRKVGIRFFKSWFSLSEKWEFDPKKIMVFIVIRKVCEGMVTSVGEQLFTMMDLAKDHNVSPLQKQDGHNYKTYFQP